MKKSTQTNVRTPVRLAIVLFAVDCLALMPAAQAINPPPDGGYPGENTAEGALALLHLNGGINNTAVGWASLGFDVTGNLNSAVGAGTLLFNTADQNTALGAGALLSNTTGFDNTAGGAFALFSNTIGAGNTAVGVQALLSNTGGNDNTAFGIDALLHNVDGSSNTAMGEAALFSNISGSRNTATGDFALNDNITGSDNIAIGFRALRSNTTGFNNTAIGNQAFVNLNGGGGINIAIGDGAGFNLTNGGGNIYIASPGVDTEFGSIRIGDSESQNRTFIAGIRGVTTGNGDAINVVIDSGGQLGTISSSRRFKKNVRPMDNASKTILALNPVKFQYKNDKTNTPQFGLVAEDVARVDPDLVVRDKSGEIYSVRYDQVNAMLLNEFLKEHKAFIEEQQTVRRLQATVASLVTTVKEQALQIQKVSTQADASRRASRLAMVDP